ncbi:MAG: NeuD/PglB/VioB family sugar acetyltransferase [Bacteroidetes bacterium]|nr:NeuD/PglB/VioB family sugar acetyltransferase [Bacteroidota bacterium]
MEKIVILGARIDGHAKVVLEIVSAEGKYEVVGFIDDKLFGSDCEIRNIPVIGTTSDLPVLKLKFGLFGAIAAIGNNLQRRLLANIIRESGLQLINAIHPSVHMDSDVVIGAGNCFCQGVIIVTGTRIGDCVNIHTGATVDHDNVIEDGANLGPGVHTSGRVTICRDAFLGAGTLVIPDGHVGEGAITGAGTVVIHPIEPFTKVVGVPARVIKYLT